MSQKNSKSHKARTQNQAGRNSSSRQSSVRWLFATLLLAVMIMALMIWNFTRGFNSERRIRESLQASFLKKDPVETLLLWDRLQEKHPESLTEKDLVDWATTALRADRPMQALNILNIWKKKNPENPNGWLLLLDIYRILGQSEEILKVFNELKPYRNVSLSAAVLAKVTLGLITDIDPQEVRSRLESWVRTEQNHASAASALLQRYLDNPLADDPNRDEQLQMGRDLVKRFPESMEARLVLFELFMTSGLSAEASELLQNWPESGRDRIAYYRLTGRFLQDFREDHQSAALAFQKALSQMPYDWKTRYRLARAYKATGREFESRSESVLMLKMRERLEPAVLEPQLNQAFPQGQPPVPYQLIALLKDLELLELAEAWSQWMEFQQKLDPIKRN